MAGRTRCAKENRSGSSMIRVETNEIAIASAKIASLSGVFSGRKVMNGIRMMSGQCQR